MYYDPTGHAGTAVTVTLPNGKTAAATITDGKTTMANGSAPPLGSTVHAANGKDYYVTSSGGVEVKSTGTATVTSTSSSGKVTSTNATIVNGSTYINGVRPSAGSIVTVHSNNEMFIVASNGKGGVTGQQITSATQVSISTGTNKSSSSGSNVISGWTVTTKPTSSMGSSTMTYQYNGVLMNSSSSVMSSTGFCIGSPMPIQVGNTQNIYHQLQGNVLDISNTRDVIRLQSWLGELGYMNPFSSTAQRADGDFGPTTLAKVIEFQKSYGGLRTDGVVDMATWNAIQSEYYRTATYTDQSIAMGNPLANMFRGDPYGYRIIEEGSSNHQGQDFRTGGASGVISVMSAMNGTVVSANYMGARGNTVVIQSSQNSDVYVVLQHLASMDVSVGASVKTGQQVGIMGSTGVGSGVHLHMEVLINPKFNDDKTSVTSPGYSMNPWLFLP